jgi:mRNA interferase RelE/StbE
MNCIVRYLAEAQRDLKGLSGDQRVLVLKAIRKVQTNPLPAAYGGYGKPLGNRGGSDLAGFLKIMLKSAGIRVVYKLVKTETEMLIVVIGARDDDEVYEAARHRIVRHGL